MRGNILPRAQTEGVEHREWFETTEKVAQGTVCVNPVEKFGLNGAKREYP